MGVNIFCLGGLFHPVFNIHSYHLYLHWEADDIVKHPSLDKLVDYLA